MELNRNHYFLAGVVILFLGVQLRSVDAFVLNEQVSKVVTKQFKNEPKVQQNPFVMSISNGVPSTTERHRFKPPKWIGWASVSMGAVLILHALAMRRPE